MKLWIWCYFTYFIISACLKALRLKWQRTSNRFNKMGKLVFVKVLRCVWIRRLRVTEYWILKSEIIPESGQVVADIIGEQVVRKVADGALYRQHMWGQGEGHVAQELGCLGRVLQSPTCLIFCLGACYSHTGCVCFASLKIHIHVKHLEHMNCEVWYQDIKKPGQCVIHKYCQIWTQAFTHLREKSIQISTRFKSSTVCSYSEWPPIAPLNKNSFVWFPTLRVSRPISAPRRRLGSMLVCPGRRLSELSTLEHPWGKLRRYS